MDYNIEVYLTQERTFDPEKMGEPVEPDFQMSKHNKTLDGVAGSYTKGEIRYYIRGWCQRLAEEIKAGVKDEHITDVVEAIRVFEWINQLLICDGCIHECRCSRVFIIYN